MRVEKMQTKEQLVESGRSHWSKGGAASMANFLDNADDLWYQCVDDAYNKGWCCPCIIATTGSCP